ncbi:hypothetical protein T439DRAFT_76556 [Meredithblackwellia eburnea MCA 4105]
MQPLPYNPPPVTYPHLNHEAAFSSLRTTLSSPPQSTTTLTSITDMIAEVQSASLTASHFEQLQSSQQQDQTALDFEAGEEHELYLIGTVAEHDALLLANFAPPHPSNPPPQNPAPGLKLRNVSTDSSNPASFVFYRTRPYAEPTPNDPTMPLWSQEHFQSDPQVAIGLRCCYVTCGLIYNPSFRHLYSQAWAITRAYFRTHSPRARLSTIQAALVDLNGRESVDPAGNFVRFGTNLAVARLLGLHKNCTSWLIPLWERDLRTRLWWALLQYDKLSALAFGRASLIPNEDREVPLPRRSKTDSPSYNAFVFLCELTIIMDDFSNTLAQQRRKHDQPGMNSLLGTLTDLSLRLDQWKARIDQYRLFSDASPGIRSLHLAYLFSALVFARAAWDAVSGEDFSVVATAQRGCLKAAKDLVDFIASLTHRDLEGYWSSHSPFFISTCLTILVRLTLQSDRTDQTDAAIWQGSVFTLRRLISALSDARRDAAYDIADLALARANYFVPILAKQAAEFSVVLQPLKKILPEPPLDDALETFLNTFNMGDPFGNINGEFYEDGSFNFQ